MVGDLHLLRSLCEDLVQIGAAGIGHGHVDGLVHEVGVIPLLGPIYELVGYDQVSGPVLLLEGADGAGGYDVFASEFPEGIHVGPVGYGGRGVLVLFSVSEEEGDLHSIDLSDHYGVGRLSVRGVGEYLLYEFEVVGIVDPGTADESNLRHICRIVEVLF